MQRELKILVADDHAVVREGLKQFLAAMPGFRVAGEAGTADEALGLVHSRKWDVIVLDLSMPGAEGLELVRKIREDRPGLPILVFSMYAEEECALDAMRAGASAYLSKDAPPQELLNAITRIAQGGRYVSANLAEKLLRQSDPQRDKLPHERLSVREYEVMIFIAQGQSLTDIGSQLHLSPKTISTYRGRILKKMGLNNNAELTRYVLQNRLEWV